MRPYLLVLERGAISSSASALGLVTAAMVTWIAELRAAGVLVGAAVTMPAAADASLCATVPVGCVVVTLPGDDDAVAVALTCPSGAGIRARPTAITLEAGARCAAPSGGRR